MGLNSGEVVVGKIGDDLRMDYTAQGHSVGLAARLQHAAAPGEIHLTEETARLVEGFFALRDRGTAVMKGVSAPLRIFELGEIGPLRTRLDVSGVRGFSRLVGREGELAWLDAILGRAAQSQGQVVGIVAGRGESARAALSRVRQSLSLAGPRGSRSALPGPWLDGPAAADPRALEEHALHR